MRIGEALRGYERLKPAYVELLASTDTWRYVHAKDSLEINAQTKIIGWYQEQTADQQLRLVGERQQRARAAAQARRRGVWVLVLALVAGVLAVK